MPRNNKIIDLDELAARVKELKAGGRKVVHSHGIFDLLHIGYIRHFEAAKKMGDVLVVTLTRDEHVKKGSHCPAFPQDVRAEAIAALEVVDYVAINLWPSSTETILLLQPDIYVKCPDENMSDTDNQSAIGREIDAVHSVAGKIRFTDDITFSSSSLLDKHFSFFTPEVDQYLEDFRHRYSLDEVLGWLEQASRLRPLVIGEVIIDEYLFCEGIGKSTKDPVLAVLQESVEEYGGGSLAVANHLAGLCSEVGLVTQLGGIERREDFVRGSLWPNVKPVFLTKSDSPTISKRRIVDRYSGNKLLEIYKMNDSLTAGEDARALCDALEKAINEWDITVVADYGHGMLTQDAIQLLSERSAFLAVNVQSNAGNRGFNPISKYRKADYVCLAGYEVAIETRQREGNLRDRVSEIAQRFDCPRFTVTQGKHGSLHYDIKTGYTEAPALATRVQDRVGAGDAVLAVTALLVRVGAPCDILSFVGNVAGAELVADLGNRVPLDRLALSKHIASLMK